MSEKFNNKIIDEFITVCQKNKSIIDQLKKNLNQKHDLDEFTKLKFDMTIDYLGDNETLFNQLIRTKILAQTMLNLYYCRSMYEKCTFSPSLNENFESNTLEYGLDSKEISEYEKLIYIILRYIVLSQTLQRRETKKIMDICEFCDNELDDDDLQCSVCLADVCPPKLQRLYYRGNSSEDTQTIENIKGNERDQVQALAASPGHGWECSICTFQNDFADTKCDACLNERLENETKSLESLDDINATERSNVVEELYNVWICPSCTFKNAKDNQFCEICFKERPLQMEATNINHENDSVTLSNEICLCQRYDRFLTHWICSRCQTCNDNSVRNCSECGYRNDNFNLCRRCIQHNESTNNDCQESKSSKDNMLSREFMETLINNDWVIINIEKFIMEREEHYHSIEDSLSSMLEMGSSYQDFASIERDFIFVRLKQSNKIGIYDGHYREYCCNNRRCMMINNNGTIHACQCGLNDGSNVANFNRIQIQIGDKYYEMLECTSCEEFNLRNNSMASRNHTTCSIL